MTQGWVHVYNNKGGGGGWLVYESQWEQTWSLKKKILRLDWNTIRLYFWDLTCPAFHVIELTHLSSPLNNKIFFFLFNSS